MIYYDKQVIYYDIIEKLWYHISARFQMYITINIGVLRLGQWYRSLGDVIKELPISVTPISESSDCDIRKTPISHWQISVKTHLESYTPVQDRAKSYVPVRTGTYQYIPVHISTGFLEKYVLVRTGTYN